MTLDWAETDKGQYQDLIYYSFYKSVLDYVEDTTVQNNLRGIVDKILTLTLNRNKIANDVELDPIMKEGTLRKGDKSPLLPGNYRPISLLSIFYKLASACITRRIKPVLARLIGAEQKAYLSENNIGSVIMNLINMIHHCNTKKRRPCCFWLIFRKHSIALIIHL